MHRLQYMTLKETEKKHTKKVQLYIGKGWTKIVTTQVLKTAWQCDTGLSIVWTVNYIVIVKY